MGFPYAYAYAFEKEDREYGLYVVDVSENIEFKLEVFHGVTQPKTRKITVYHSSDSFDPKTLEEEIGSIKLGFGGLFTHDVVEYERKLHYLLTTDNDILLAYFDRDIATYIAISEGTPKNDAGQPDLDIFSLACTTKGALLGQVREAIDSRCTYDGDKITDNDALNLFAVELDINAEYAYFGVTQNGYMLPWGNYEMVARLRASVDASDNIAIMQVYNVTDSSENASCTKTLTTDYKIYTCAVTIDSLDDGDNIRFRVSKEDVSGNVYVDFLGFVAKQ